MNIDFIRQIPIGGFDDNFSYFIREPEEKNIAIVDPGNVRHLVAEIDQDGLVPKMVLITHSHFDHVEGVEEMVEKYGIPVFMHENARGKLELSDEMCVFLKDQEKVDLGILNIEVLHTPGHCDDSVCYFVSAKEAEDGKNHLISGDTLFVEGCGRAAAKEGSVKELYKSLERLKKLPGDTIVYPGHNYGSKAKSTIKEELKKNIYLLCKNFEEFEALRVKK